MLKKYNYFWVACMNEKNSSITIGFFKKPFFPKKFPAKKLLISLFLFFLLGVLVGGVTYLKNKPKPSDEKASFVTTEKEFITLQNKQQPQNALRTVQKYLNKNPKNNAYKSRAEFYLAEAYLALNNTQTARKYAEQSLATQKSDNYDVYMFLGKLCKSLGDKRAAIDYFKQSISILDSYKSDNSQVVNNLGYAKANVKALESNKKVNSWGF